MIVGEPAATFPLRYDVRIEVPSTLRVDTNLLRLVASADLTLQGTYDRPVIAGHADIERGDVNFEGRRYRITRGAIDFNNPTRTEPFFDIQAETNVRVAGPPVQTYHINIGFAGHDRPAAADGQFRSIAADGRCAGAALQRRAAQQPAGRRAARAPKSEPGAKPTSWPPGRRRR